MTRMMLAVLALLGAFLAAPAAAEPLNPQQVAAEAKWLMHVDFDAFRHTALAERIREKKLDDPKVQQWIGMVDERYGVDLRKDLHGLTVYGMEHREHPEGVAILSAQLDPQKIIRAMKKGRGYKTSEYGDYTLHTWTRRSDRKPSKPKVEYSEEDKDVRYGAIDAGLCDHHEDEDDDDADRRRDGWPPRTLTAAFFDGGVVVSRDPQRVEQALDVLDEKSDALATDSPLLGDRPDGTVFYVAARDLQEIEPRGKMRRHLAILKQGEHLSLAMGEHDGKAFVHKQFTAVSPEIAEQIGKIAGGFQALLDLQAEDNEQLAKIAKGLKWHVDGKTLTVEWEADAEQLLDLMKKHHEEHAPPHRERQKARDRDKDQEKDA